MGVQRSSLTIDACREELGNKAKLYMYIYILNVCIHCTLYTCRSLCFISFITSKIILGTRVMYMYMYVHKYMYISQLTNEVLNASPFFAKDDKVSDH